MKRHTIATPRRDWKAEMENLGFTYHTIDGDKYWTEDGYYEFTEEQVEKIYTATKELADMCFKAVDYVIDNDLFHKLKIPADLGRMIKARWDADEPTLYGRFDLCWDGGSGPIKMYEYNADTPTSLMEASVAQFAWMQSYFPEADQYNSIHETLKEQLSFIRDKHLPVGAVMYFTCVAESEEDWRTTQYLVDVAREVGIDSRLIAIADIGHNGDHFIDLEGGKMEYIFKLYPWEWLENEEFGKFAFRDVALWFEPVWKMILSNKGILPILWEMFPNHPNLLEAYFDEDGRPEIVDGMGNACYVRKPIFSREGANIDIVSKGEELSSSGSYGKEGHIIQRFHPLPKFGDSYTVIGSWVVGDEPCGMGIREDDSLITKNTSRFVPHIFR